MIGTDTMFGSKEPARGVRVVITDTDLGHPEIVGAAGTVESVHDGGCMNVRFEQITLGYRSIHLRPDQIEVSPYQGEPLVAVNNHD